ncbi:hypothetical protein [Saccharothrix sp. Mg75]|uniref:hypothetical protein n=1 Tax=Saccharothrix sp. Mg75 TaxID=3445357 RepID=UPI003EEE73A6
MIVRENADGLLIAPLSGSRPRRGTRHVEARTFWGDYWILLDQVVPVSAADLDGTWYGPERIKSQLMAAVRRELDKPAG